MFIDDTAQQEKVETGSRAENEDRRIGRTRRLLGEALIELALEKGFDAVTIQEVTARADVGYRTFFRHYSDTQSLLLDTLEVRQQEWRQILPFPDGDQQSFFDPAATPEENGLHLFQYVQQNHDLMLVVLGPQGCRTARALVFGVGQAKAQQLLAELNHSTMESPIIANHVTAATLALIEWWLVNEMPHPPAQMGAIFADLIVKPMWALIAVKG